MIDQEQLNSIIASTVADAVKEEVAKLFQTDENLLGNLRSQAVSLLARNFNLTDAVKAAIASEVAKHLANMLLDQTNDTPNVDVSGINREVTDNILAATNNQIGMLIKNDSKLLGNIKSQAVINLVRQFDNEVNIPDIIKNRVHEQFAEQFADTGIYNAASQRELTVMDDAVVVENTLTANNANVVGQFTTKDATVDGDLAVGGNLRLSSDTWATLTTKMKADMITEIADGVRDEMIDAVMSRPNEFNFSSIQLDSAPVLSGNTLGNQITQSSLTKVGTLENLDVIGEANIGPLHTTRNRRVGINTPTPNAALAVWDEEVEVIMGKFKEHNAFIGTNKQQELSIGVNYKQDLHIDREGVVTIKKLKLGLRSIAHGDNVPGYAGTPGDIVLNTKLTTDNPVFAWYCLGNYSWVPLKAVI